MYILNEKISNNGDIISNNINSNSFLMESKNKSFRIQGNEITELRISDRSIANPIVTAKVLSKYKKLLAYLTELLVDDDDSGDTYREALNQIEKFRLEIKNKYRDYLLKKELEMMSKQLVLLQKEANNRLLEIHNSYLETLSNNRSR